MIFKQIFTALVITLFAYPLFAAKQLTPEGIEGVIRVNAEQVYNLIVSKPNLIIIDARRLEEYRKGHIEGSINLLDDDMTESGLGKLVGDKNNPILFYCNGVSCMRSGNACKKAVSWGYNNIFWFRGGWKEWVKKEMPISK